MRLTVGSFNLNNLFDRFNYAVELAALPKGDQKVVTEITVEPAGPGEPPNWVRKHHGRLIKAKPVAERKKLAERIVAMGVDVLCVQEVEDIQALREFNAGATEHGGLDGMYRHQALIEGNDPRFIDVGVLSKLPLGGLTSWAHTRHPDERSDPVFARDFLEIDVLDANFARVVLKIFNTHLKSHFVPHDDPDPVAAAAAGDRRRRQQAEMAAGIVAKRTSSRTPFVVLGDLNDPVDSPHLAPLLQSPELRLVNALAHARESRPFTDDPPPPTHLWTHRYRDSQAKRTDFELFDHIWLGPALADNLTDAVIERRRTKTTDGSDHDPPWIALEL